MQRDVFIVNSQLIAAVERYFSAHNEVFQMIIDFSFCGCLCRCDTIAIRCLGFDFAIAEWLWVRDEMWTWTSWHRRRGRMVTSWKLLAAIAAGMLPICCRINWIRCHPFLLFLCVWCFCWLCTKCGTTLFKRALIALGNWYDQHARIHHRHRQLMKYSVHVKLDFQV